MRKCSAWFEKQKLAAIVMQPFSGWLQQQSLSRIGCPTCPTYWLLTEYWIKFLANLLIRQSPNFLINLSLEMTLSCNWIWRRKHFAYPIYRRRFIMGIGSMFKQDELSNQLFPSSVKRSQSQFFLLTPSLTEYLNKIKNIWTAKSCKTF